MYTHARQFPHLAGMSDAEIRVVARRGMSRRRGLVIVMRLRNAGVVVGMVVGARLLIDSGGLGAGESLMIVGAAATALVLIWNLVWVNTVLFRVTRTEVERGGDEGESANPS